MKFDSKGWTQACVSKIFKKALEYANLSALEHVLVNFDMPDSKTVRGSTLQKTLLSIRGFAENLGKWYGVCTTFQCFPSRRCPVCGGHLREYKTKRTRVAYCSCGFLKTETLSPSTGG
jgi:hypothetical protein